MEWREKERQQILAFQPLQELVQIITNEFQNSNLNSCDTVGSVWVFWWTWPDLVLILSSLTSSRLLLHSLIALHRNWITWHLPQLSTRIWKENSLTSLKWKRRLKMLNIVKHNITRSETLEKRIQMFQKWRIELFSTKNSVYCSTSQLLFSPQNTR